MAEDLPQIDTPPLEPTLDPTVDFVAGTVAGIASLTVGYPFDTVKVRLQNPETAVKYRSTFNAIATIVREERMIGLFKGLTAPLAACSLLNGFVFANFGFFLRIQPTDGLREPTLSQVFLAGTATGIVASIITCPMELIKIRQQNSLSKPPSTRQVIADIWRRRGFTGLYRGYTATAVRECGFGTYFAAYEGACRFFRYLTVPDPYQFTSLNDSSSRPQSHNDSAISNGNLAWPLLMCAGGFAGVASWFSTFPFDVIKTRVQSIDYPRGVQEFIHESSDGLLKGAKSGKQSLMPLRQDFYSSHSEAPTVSIPGASRIRHPYQTTRSTIAHSYRTEGFQVFFRGLSPTLIRAIPVNMVTFGVFEACVRLMS